MDSTLEELTAEQYVERQRELEIEAREAYPYKFDECTYSKGYLKQTLYACLTCQREADSLNGVCYSCSISCHADHELVELFHKRHFQCDCGTSRTGHESCTIRKSKAERAPENQYNHNFQGRFCSCDTFYDPEQESGTMFQCILCEDWFHDRCLEASNQGKPLPDSESFEWVVCKDCVSKYKDCLLNPQHEFPYKKEELVVPQFLDEQFREHLCQCDPCMEIRKTQMPILIEDEPIYEQPEDSDMEDEADAGVEDMRSLDEIVSSTMQDVLHVLDRLPRVQAIEGVHAYNRLKNELTDFLLPFARENKVVTKEDISNFFLERLNSGKNGG
ncbi:ubiquitin protein ligase E3 component N-recognin 7-like protein Mlo2-like [Schizosaccharomyces osmophilus]|uniref:Ubiquitin protein ligase E3 component N-recognin 7-like protein Mlo2-like n=1 Tax=Schizosaccharomyces osmophilus TaxID=2545709 RepID=A0AAE9W7D3_9SCHI|nr:ubiquitin protein ligase E3 component N-recognin 7-like protein Mlo2-like [Schizosaccharomyces osmophilus]WBW70795.1 ubiquitin protein ligase E3 component N-recognin 7-like protein Mlo2-like [Schizosaccharomyces osmophilus]